ncbi:MAG: anthranilate phosphoribosyltransferase [Alphaproteobacteria bacterium]|nr:anthranilate phosphoribosyltransferase [Alphaproteobacteria bacterium]
MTFKELTKKVADGGRLSADESQEAFNAILSGEPSPILTAAFLTSLHQRGETTDEVLGAVRALRIRMTIFPGAEDAVDVCGTGGDQHGTVNVSTAVAFVLAGAGVKVAKHGNRAVSSRSGSSDILSELGIKMDVPANKMRKALDAANVCFLHAPIYHAAMKHVSAIRAELGFRTIFNLIGPLTNPARVRRQVIGVFDKNWCDPMARILQTLGSDHVWVVHGGDGMDEITTTTSTYVVEQARESMRSFDITPKQEGVKTASLEQLKGGDAKTNAGHFKKLLNREKGAYRDIVCLNAAAGLIIGGKAKHLKDGMGLAAEAIDSGKAAAALEKLIQITNE